MKGKLITMGILAAVGILGLIILIIGVIGILASVSENDASISYSEQDNSIPIGAIITMVIGVLIYFGCSITSFVMGIIVLVNKDKRGIVIATGIMGILGALFMVNVILGFVAAFASPEIKSDTQLISEKK